MSVVQYDELFDKKVKAGAEALLKNRIEQDVPRALSDARIVLLTAMRVEAEAMSELEGK